MKKLRPGALSAYFNKRAIVLFLLLSTSLVVVFAYKFWREDTSEGCVTCHGNKELMEKVGYPYMYTTNEIVQKESKHPNVQCRDCHLGDGRTLNSKKAHKGMLKAILVTEKGGVAERGKYYDGPILQTGNNKIFDLLPKVSENNQLYVSDEVRNLLWHDRDLNTFNFDPEIAKKTCSKSNCHPQELKQFKKSIMGRNYRQRYMKTWTKPYGPHNCGPSFADLPPIEELNGAGFDYKNTEEIIKDLNVPFTKEQAEVKQKFCNICHAGCLDCHYTPSREEGVHSFKKTPTPESCSGFGRGTSICHPGALQARRGETYIGGDYSIPFGMKPDVHYKKGINCVDCHPTGKAGMGDIERNANCGDCHMEIEDAHANSIHKKLDCATCHIEELGGYQLTVWGPGTVSKKPNPFKKYSLYYGIQKPPIIVKDQKGIWRPYKIWPHSVGNIKNPVLPSPALQYRWPEGQTKDAYFIVGTFDGLPQNNNHLLWIQFDQASHPYGKARNCNSCHESKTQVSESTWEFFDNYGAEPFTGKHNIVADSESLRITDLENTSPIVLLEGANMSDFASWVYLKDKWKATGDFSINIDYEKYKKYLSISTEINNLLQSTNIDALSLKTQKQFKAIKGIALHNEDEGLQEINRFYTKTGLHLEKSGLIEQNKQ